MTREDKLGISGVEIRKDPRLLGQSVILIPQFTGNLGDSQTSTEGTSILPYSKNGSEVDVKSPDKHHLFILEEVREIEGVGLYDRVSGFGADERLEARGIFSPTSLELLISTFIKRTKELKQGEKGSSLRQFHAYGIYKTDDSSLTGRLLASREIAPNIQNELGESNHYFHFNNRERCMYCDITKQERNSAESSEHRVVFYHDELVFDSKGNLLYNNGAIAFVPFAPIDQHNVHILPFKHTPRLTDLSEKQTAYLADILYKCLLSISIDAKAMQREVHNLEFAIHSVPFYSKDDVHLRSNDNNRVDEYSHTYIEISPQETTSYNIPGSGWLVVPDRPKDTAARLRHIIAEMK